MGVSRCAVAHGRVFRRVHAIQIHTKWSRPVVVRRPVPTYVHARVYVGPIFYQGQTKFGIRSIYTAQIGFEVYRAEILRGPAYPPEGSRLGKLCAGGPVNAEQPRGNEITRRRSCRLF